jgi:hypothetical protein
VPILDGRQSQPRRYRGIGFMRYIVWTASIFCAAGCGERAAELARVASPAGKWEACLTEYSGGGAAGAVLFVVDIVPRGARPSSNTSYISCMDLDVPTLRWSSGDTLLLTGKAGHVQMLKSPAILKSADGKSDTVQVVARLPAE